MHNMSMEEIADSWNKADSATPRTFQRAAPPPPSTLPTTTPRMDLPKPPLDIVPVVKTPRGTVGEVMVESEGTSASKVSEPLP